MKEITDSEISKIEALLDETQESHINGMPIHVMKALVRSRRFFELDRLNEISEHYDTITSPTLVPQEYIDWRRSKGDTEIPRTTNLNIIYCDGVTIDIADVLKDVCFVYIRERQSIIVGGFETLEGSSGRGLLERIASSSPGTEFSITAQVLPSCGYAIYLTNANKGGRGPGEYEDAPVSNPMMLVGV